MKLLPHQVAAAASACDATANRWLFADEMGCGKTAEAIEAWRKLGIERGVVVAPALARSGWVKQFKKWWPERAGDVAMIDMSPGRKTQSKKRRASWEEVLKRPIRIVSPELLTPNREKHLLEGGGVLAIDEIHMLSNPGSKRSGVLRDMANRHKGPIFGMSATPIPNKVIGLFNVIDTIWHRRFGRGDGRRAGYEFCNHYLERILTENGTLWGGLLDESAAELRMRLSWMMSRTTRAALAGQIPPCQIKPLRFLGGDPDKFILDWAKEAMEGAAHIAVLTHKRATAKHLAQLFNELGRPVVHVDGGVPTTERVKRLDALQEQAAGFVVSTMHAVAESISLSWCHRSLLAELYWSPKVLTQVIGRFPRLDGTAPTVLEVLCGGNSVEERMAVSLSDKLWQISQVTQEGEAEAGLSSALSNEENMEQMLMDAAFSTCTDEELDLLTGMGEED